MPLTITECFGISKSKESWPKGPDFGLSLKGAVLLKADKLKVSKVI